MPVSGKVAETNQVPDVTDARFQLGHHFPELDGIRGLAALLVIFHHIALYFPAPPLNGFLKWWLIFTREGFVGVDIFFALSGFLITRILIETRGKSHFYRNFYARRVLRLAPPYLITLVLVAIAIPGSGKFLLLSFFYLANFSPLFGVAMAYPVLWSLAVEEQFYLIWPWLIRFVSRRSLLIIGSTIVIASPIARHLAFSRDDSGLYYTWFRCDGLMWGALLSIICTSPRATRLLVRRYASATCAIGGLIWLLCVITPHIIKGSTSISEALIYSGCPMATAGVIGLATVSSNASMLAVFRIPLLRFAGDISYWMYLIHYLFVRYFGGVAKRLVTIGHARSDWTIYFFLVLTVMTPTILSGIAVRRLLELPVLSLKKHFR